MTVHAERFFRRISENCIKERLRRRSRPRANPKGLSTGAGAKVKAANVLVGLGLANVMMLAQTTPGVAATDQHGAIQRDAPSGTVRLVARGTPVKFEIDKVCRYDPESTRWYRQNVAPVDKVLGADVVVFELADGVGLYWVQWKENGRPFASMAVNGPVLCNDIALAPSSRSDVIASCIPLQHSARAAYVPDPNIYCGQ